MPKGVYIHKYGQKRSEECRRRMSLVQIGNKNNLGKRLSDATKAKIGNANRGKIRSSELRQRWSETKKGRKNPHPGVPRSDEAKRKISEYQKSKKLSLETKKRIADANRGNKSHLWRGGKTKETLRLRATLEYREWRKAVFERDDYTCQHCGSRGGRLDPHHVKPFATHPDLRFEISNGLTLCHDCHKKTDSFGVIVPLEKLADV